MRWRDPVTLIRTEWKPNLALARLVAAETRRIVDAELARHAAQIGPQPRAIPDDTE